MVKIMNFNNANAINFSYLLIEMYKKVGLQEDELAVVLVIDHLLSQGNSLITSSTIALNMNYDEKQVDSILAKLYEKKYIDINVSQSGITVSLSSLKDILYHKFQESIFTEKQLKEDEDAEKIRSDAFNTLEKLFNRSLTPVEINRIDDWLSDSDNYEFIPEVLKEAVSKRYTNINQLDRALIKRIRQSLIKQDDK